MMTIFGIFVMAIAITVAATPAEILDLWIGYFRSLWNMIKYILKLIFKKNT